MLGYIGRRFLYMISTLFLVSVVGFLIINLPTGTYVDFYIQRLQNEGTHTSLEQIEAITKRFALDKPLYWQYGKWLFGFVRGDFGLSFEFNKEVKELIWERIVYTVIISLATLIFTWVVAIPIGIYSATHQYTLGDHIFTLVGLIGLSAPSFLLALVLMVIAQRSFGQSVGGLYSPAFVDAPWSWAKLADLLKHLVVPIVVVGASGTASLVRMMRGNLLDILNMQYVQAARARGLSESLVILKHAVRNAIHPLIMLLGMSLPSIISGATVVSIVLSLPTTGPMYFRALQQQDMYLAVTFLVFMAIMLVIGNFLADLLLAWVDPRIRYE
ncbi:MAG: ABC transporter permease [Chloroflexi bacterium]|nr:ABC transporter permease [Chloroflexota bacterium]